MRPLSAFVRIGPYPPPPCVLRTSFMDDLNSHHQSCFNSDRQQMVFNVHDLLIFQTQPLFNLSAPPPRTRLSDDVKPGFPVWQMSSLPGFSSSQKLRVLNITINRQFWNQDVPTEIYTEIPVKIQQQRTEERKLPKQ